MRDTIYALSSGSLPAGVALIRISGPEAGPALRSFCMALPEPRRATLYDIADGGTLLDRGVVLWFPGPASFTGEDVAELHLHGGRAVVTAVLDSLAKRSAMRHALPGEFSRRAFENGRLDLTQVEGLSDLIAAETELQRRQAVLQAGGEFRRRCEGWRDRLIVLRAKVEATLDFSDEDNVSEFGADRATTEVRALGDEIEQVLEEPAGERIREGLRVALMGLPNSGKSTLLNALAGRDVAIVTSEAGTTRDILEVGLDVGGYPVVVFDTAGIREAGSLAEGEGIRRAIAVGSQADLVLWLAEPGCEFDVEVVGQTRAEIVRVRTKIDIAEAGGGDIGLSASTGFGMDRLVMLLRARAETALGTGQGLVSRARHREWLTVAASSLREAERHQAAEIRADLLRRASDAIGRVTGRVGVEDMLDSLFGEFCIGK